MEIRLIDACEAKKRLLSYYFFVDENPSKESSVGVALLCGEAAQNIEDRIDSVPTVDHETLPIVQKLREELARVTEERDAAICLCGKLIALCSPPKEWVPRLFRRHINRPGDYMGSGYDFLDSFNRIFEHFAETAEDGLYTAVREAAEKEILERTQRMIGQKEE